ncbi:MAG: hypothetical protein J7521_19350 [Caulobacter sp.]|nr:hypothetical protein [Caulobacter sp.]
MSTSQVAATPDAAGVEEELAEFRLHLTTLAPVQRRILSVLMPRLVALDEKGDVNGALAILEQVRGILWEGRLTRH